MALLENKRIFSIEYKRIFSIEFWQQKITSQDLFIIVFWLTLYIK